MRIFINFDQEKLLLKKDLQNKGIIGIFSFLKEDGCEKIGSDFGYLHKDYKNKVVITHAQFKNLVEKQ